MSDESRRAVSDLGAREFEFGWRSGADISRTTAGCGHDLSGQARKQSQATAGLKPGGVAHSGRVTNLPSAATVTPIGKLALDEFLALIEKLAIAIAIPSVPS